MNYETFKINTLNALKNYFKDSAEVSVQTIARNNDILLDGLMIQKKNSNISPAIYLNYYYEDYQNGIAFSAVIEDILRLFEKNCPSQTFDLSFFTDYTKAAPKIIYKLIHFEKNQHLLSEVPYFRFLDFAIVFCCLIPNASERNATILIHNHHLTLWNITTEQLYQLACQNTPRLLPFEISTMKDILSAVPISLNDNEIMEKAAQEFPMYVLTNRANLYGASCILYPNVLSSFAGNLGCDLYVIPSSIHEVLLVPADSFLTKDALNIMISDVNSTQVAEEELLSDHVYYFSRQKGFLSA